MLRRAVLAMLTLLAVFAASCGRQVTPNPPTTNLSGRMVITFGVQGTMDFTNYNYAIILNTCGSGNPPEPYPQAFQTGFGSYSYVFVAGASYGGLTAEPSLFQYLLASGSSNQLNPHGVPVGTSTVQFVYPYNGLTSQFQLTFLRSQLNNPLQTSNPCPFVSPTPTPSPSPSATPGATPPPGSTPTPSPSPSATPNPNASVWYINFFTLDRSNNVLDSLGQNGPTDTSFTLPVNVTESVQMPIVRPAGAITAGNPAAAISGGEVDNYP